MLPQKNRLKRKKDFNLTFKKGKSFRSKLVEIKLRKVEGNEKKFAFVAPVKCFKKATERNRVKRILREIIREKTDKIVNGVNVIFIAKEDFLNHNFEEIEKEVNKSLNKFKLLKK